MRLRNLAATAAFLIAGSASAQFAARPVSLVVGFPPGGSNDVAARILAPELAKAIGTSVVVVNKPGANATIGADFVAKAAPDGHTVLVASASPLVIVPHTAPSIPYDALRDFVPVTTLGVTPGAIGLNIGVPARTLRQFMDQAATKGLRIASTGAGGMPHLTIELLKRGTKLDAVIHVPYKGAALAVTDVMGGHVDGIVADYASLIALFKDGRLRPLVVTGRKRVDGMADIPTAVEQGYPGLVAENWLGVFVPANTPPALVEKLYTSISAIMLQPAFREQMALVGYTVTDSPRPAAFQAFLRDEFERWGRVAKESGARTD